MASPTARPPPSPVLLVVLLVALATGVAASLLIGAGTGPSAPVGRASEVLIPSGLLADGLLGSALLLVAALVLRRLRGGSVSVPNRFVVTFLVAVLVAVLLITAFRTVGGGGPEPTGAVPTGPNSTGPPPTNTTGTNLSGPGGTLYLLPSLPG